MEKHAGRFWDHHGKRCIDEGTLTASTVDTFLILCRVYAAIEQLDISKGLDDPKDKSIMKFTPLVKLYEKLSVQFGLTAKKKTKPKTSIADIVKKAKEQSAVQAEKAETVKP